MEMVVQGVSTRKVSAITEELCGASFSKSTVSALCVGLDARVKAFNERRLEGEYPFVLVDAMFIQSRQEDRVLMRTVLIVSGVRSDGVRESLVLPLLLRSHTNKPLSLLTQPDASAKPFSSLSK